MPTSQLEQDRQRRVPRWAWDLYGKLFCDDLPRNIVGVSVRRAGPQPGEIFIWQWPYSFQTEARLDFQTATHRDYERAIKSLRAEPAGVGVCRRALSAAGLIEAE